MVILHGVTVNLEILNINGINSIGNILSFSMSFRLLVFGHWIYLVYFSISRFSIIDCFIGMHEASTLTHPHRLFSVLIYKAPFTQTSCETSFLMLLSLLSSTCQKCGWGVKMPWRLAFVIGWLFACVWSKFSWTLLQPWTLSPCRSQEESVQVAVYILRMGYVCTWFNQTLVFTGAGFFLISLLDSSHWAGWFSVGCELAALCGEAGRRCGCREAQNLAVSMTTVTNGDRAGGRSVAGQGPKLSEWRTWGDLLFNKTCLLFRRSF